VKVLLDHCVDRRVGPVLVGHEVLTAAAMGCDALKNGRLLKVAADAGFEVFVTTDKNLRHEQNLATLPLPGVELHSIDTRLHALIPLLARFEDALVVLRLCGYVAIHPDGRIERVAP